MVMRRGMFEGCAGQVDRGVWGGGQGRREGNKRWEMVTGLEGASLGSMQSLSPKLMTLQCGPLVQK